MNDFEWDNYFLKKAELVATLSPCFRSKVGAVIVKYHQQISEGFNRSPINQPDCKKIGWCYRDQNAIESGTQPEKCRARGSHAEMNAIINAAKNGSGIGLANATMYVHGNSEICPDCRGIIANAEIAMVVYRSRDGEIQHINVGYDWTIHPVDQQRKLNEWIGNVKSE